MFESLSADAIKGTKIIKVDEIVSEIKSLKIGNKEIIIVPVGIKAHTPEDLFIFIPDEKTIFSGDLVMNGRITSNRHGSVIGTLKALDMINKKDWNYLIAGHGFDTSKTAMDETLKYFTLLKERILKAIEDETSGSEITKVVTMEEFKDKALYDDLNNNNVFDAFRELEFYEGD
jgi:glyoxylase-like metal-dependent hydrolase (beta-lactamase superfamily II)